MKRVKQYECLAEGCLRITLVNGKAFDPYRLTLINAHCRALPCQRRQAARTTFYYDINERISLRDLLAHCVFSQAEACALFLRLFKELAAAMHELPIYANVDTIFVDPCHQEFAFVALPIHDAALTQDWGVLLQEILEVVQMQGDSLYGCLHRFGVSEDVDGIVILQGLELWQKRHRWHQRIGEYFFHLRTKRQRRCENERSIQNLLKNQQFQYRFHQINESKRMNEIPRSSGRNETVELFRQMKCDSHD